MWLNAFALVAAAAPGESTSPWSGSRWFVEIEETTPSPLELSAEENFSFRTRALQVQAVLSCPTAQPFGKKTEVTCKFEALAVRATPRTLVAEEALNPGNQKVLDDVVRRLHGTKVVFMTTPDGRVTTVDLPEIAASTRRESESREILRRVVYDVVAGFSLDRPETLAAGATWTEKSSALLRAPTQPALLGNTRTEHNFSVVDGVKVIQSSGKGAFTAPYIPWEFGYDGKLMQKGSNSGSTVSKGGGMGAAGGVSASAANDGRLVSQGSGPQATTPTDYSFSGTLTSVAVVREGTTFIQERVWEMWAAPTASSLGNMQGTSLYYGGHLRQLGPVEAVQLGPTEIVAPPGQSLEGIGAWIPVPTF